MTEKLLLTFPSVNFAIRAEKTLIGEGIETKMIPTPRDVSTSCGLCLLIPIEQLEAIESGSIDLVVDRLYVYDKENGSITQRPARG